MQSGFKAQVRLIKKRKYLVFVAKICGNKYLRNNKNYKGCTKQLQFTHVPPIGRIKRPTRSIAWLTPMTLPRKLRYNATIWLKRAMK